MITALTIHWLVWALVPLGLLAFAALYHVIEFLLGEWK